MSFPKDFRWGAATSSYQIEGGGLDYGRGECVWHRFSHTPGKVIKDHNGDVACNHIELYQQDVALMQSLGLDMYRFSVSWPRVLPAGTGAVNQQGLAFYDRLIDALLEAGIEPFMTLYHWDFPQALQDRGGWSSPDSVDWFVEYADLASRQYGDRVKKWITHNEPWTYAMAGHLMGNHAPGIRDPKTAYAVAHHLLISHGKSVPVIRANCPDAQVGIALNMTVADPVTDSEADKAATQRWVDFFNAWFLDPVFRGRYPAEYSRYLSNRGVLNDINVDDIAQARVPMDFLGVNYYNRMLIRAEESAGFLSLSEGRNPDAEYTRMDWEVYPEGLSRTVLHLHHEYAPAAMYITENGCSYDDPLPVNGVVEDPRRVAYYESHLDALERAITQGAPVKGYFAWSLMDNFEWERGYDMRFGIHYVDFETQERFPKRSALYYKERIVAERQQAG